MLLPRTLRPLLSGLALLFAASIPAVAQQDPAEVNIWGTLELRYPVADQCGETKFRSTIDVIAPPRRILGRDSTTQEQIVATSLCASGRTVVYTIPRSQVTTLFTRGTDILHPVRFPLDSLQSENAPDPDECRRDRTGWWIFDKFEARLMVGYRGGKDSVFYPDAAGGTMWRSLFNGNTRGGSSTFESIEFAGLWSLDARDRFYLGFLTGLWPIDGGWFVPLSLHARFDQQLSPFVRCCPILYFYGDVGVPIDRSLFDHGDVVRQLFYGAGVGIDWGVADSYDLGVDIGVRVMNNPLPAIDCCPDIEDEVRYPFRRSVGGILRLGLTW